MAYTRNFVINIFQILHFRCSLMIDKNIIRLNFKIGIPDIPNEFDDI